eukprot:SAG11_NODE_15431_length_578_cov_1.787056_1_plen_114_part_01
MVRGFISSAQSHAQRDAPPPWSDGYRLFGLGSANGCSSTAHRSAADADATSASKSQERQQQPRRRAIPRALRTPPKSVGILSPRDDEMSSSTPEQTHARREACGGAGTGGYPVS